MALPKITRREVWRHQTDPERMGHILMRMAMANVDSFGSRKTKARSQASMYEGIWLTSFDADGYEGAVYEGAVGAINSDSPGSEKQAEYQQTHNIGARVLDSIDAKIFSMQNQTKTRVVVNGGGWDAKVAAVKSARFVEGQMQEPQGVFPNLWECWRHAARTATVATGTGAVFFEADPKRGKIIAEMDDTLNMFIETSGMPYDGYSSIGRVVYWDPDMLIAKCPKYAEQIERAAVNVELIEQWQGLYMLENDRDYSTPITLRVPVVQGWAMQIGGGKAAGGLDGVRCTAIPGQTLDVRPYDYDYPPCVIFNPMRDLAGKWGRSVMERIVPAVQRYNQILNSVDNAERLTPRREKYFDPTMTDIEKIKTINDCLYIPHTGPMSQLPAEVNPVPFNHAPIEWLMALHRESAFSLPGLNEAAVTMDLGKTMSGAALRLKKNEIYEILAPFENEYVRCSGPDTFKQIVRCAQEMTKAGVKFSSLWDGGQKGGWLQDIAPDVFDVLTKHKYRCTPQPVSAAVGTPSENVQTAKELMEMGVITGEAYAQILQTFDLHGSTAASQLLDAEQDLVERMIDDWMYASLDDARERTIEPEIWMDRNGMMTLSLGAAYLRARMDTVQDRKEQSVKARLGFFRNYLKQLSDNATKRKQALLEEQQANQAASQVAPAPGPAPAPGQQTAAMQ